MKITGDEAYITNSTDLWVTCPIEGPDQDVYTLVCNDQGLDFVYLRLDDGILKVVVDDEVRNFVRK